ncbi:Mediator of RNA polymerase II transcription subunit 18 [Neolecta irregularis DAH-3]|uniref:Mediator of RNA polymerase II transcription subunit 18 n=1 Tax=Neolecta irregularis (strain DAH-3) TaxID=1198029 RepID=A0A1U7LQK3_NEOID|nr:Mediator of RNA polymerase II transcription subunit 18 [Neolecta irregularis DAH-3]|eukprot:OLL24801.1 Mediator of RNA polymerase II transcription subunit 18 [Neolecta irregularis DAH-3]
MQELSLYANIQDIESFLLFLTAYSGSRPIEFSEHHIIFKPISRAPSTKNIHPTQTKPLVVLELCGNRNRIARTQLEDDLISKINWSVVFADTPEANNKHELTSRVILKSDVNNGDAIKFVQSLGYSYSHEYMRNGKYAVRNNSVLSVFQVLQPKHAYDDQNQSFDFTDQWILQASITVDNSQDPFLVTQASEELKAIRADLRGICDLEQASRQSLDTRIIII